MSNIEILSFKADHIDDVLKIDNLCFSTPWRRESFEKELENSKFAKYVVAKKDGVIMGYAGMWIILDEGHITNVAIHPDYRGIGGGIALLESLIEICKIELVTCMTLEVRASNIIAQHLYEKYGFAEEGIRKGYYADNKEDAIIMWKHDVQN